jgi:predicted metal-dependent phosphotriesterase family hydrolase
MIETVRGPIPPEKFGIALPHEHVMVDFIGADKTGPHRWNAEEVYEVMLPYLQAARKQGISGFVDCTPAYLGRDVRILRRLSETTGLHILTNTGLYKEPYLPPYAFTESVEQLAERWIRESREGIDGTGIRPGFIKIAIQPGPLPLIQKKIVRTAARTALHTGLSIACHSGHGPATMETLDLLQKEGFPLTRFIFVHADAEPDRKYHLEAARAGAWVEYDAIGWRPITEHLKLITQFLADGFAARLLLSHDAGWYHVGEERGGNIKPFTTLLGELIPALEKEGLTPDQRKQLLIKNPQAAFTRAQTGHP